MYNSNQTSIQRSPRFSQVTIPLFIILAFISFAVYEIMGELNWVVLILFGLMILIGLVTILADPFIGFILLGTLPIALDLWPNLSIFPSIALPLGAITAIGYFFRPVHERRINSYQRRLVIPLLLFLGLVFVLIIILMNPEAAFGLTSNRNWVFTFLQLYIYMWLTSQMLNSVQRFRTFMLAFSIMAIISALVAIYQTVATQTLFVGRSVGLSSNPNFAAYNFTIALAFLSFLHITTQNSFKRLLAYLGMGLLFIATLSTLSRTGMVLFIIAFVLILQTRLSLNHRVQYLFGVLVFVLIVFAVLVPSDLLSQFETRTSIVQDDIRFALWDSAFNMFLDYPLTGVGTGRFPQFVGLYSNNAYLRSIGPITAHSAYFNTLAENGIIAFVIFLAMLLISLWICLKKLRYYSNSEEKRQIILTWIIIWVIFVVQSFSANTQYDKFFWLTLGVYAFLSQKEPFGTIANG